MFAANKRGDKLLNFHALEILKHISRNILVPLEVIPHGLQHPHDAVPIEVDVVLLFAQSFIVSLGNTPTSMKSPGMMVIDMLTKSVW